LTIDDGSRVKDVIEKLSLLYGDEIRDAIMESSNKPKQGISILVNGRNIFAYEGFAYELNDNDEMLILPPVGGG
jgi:molybdopterin synthase sulfur carrier subunit